MLRDTTPVQEFSLAVKGAENYHRRAMGAANVYMRSRMTTSYLYVSIYAFSNAALELAVLDLPATRTFDPDTEDPSWQRAAVLMEYMLQNSAMDSNIGYGCMQQMEKAGTFVQTSVRSSTDTDFVAMVVVLALLLLLFVFYFMPLIGRMLIHRDAALKIIACIPLNVLQAVAASKQVIFTKVAAREVRVQTGVHQLDRWLLQIVVTHRSLSAAGPRAVQLI